MCMQCCKSIFFPLRLSLLMKWLMGMSANRTQLKNLKNSSNLLREILLIFLRGYAEQSLKMGTPENRSPKQSELQIHTLIFDEVEGFDSKMGTEGIEPPHAALEAASLPLAYAPNSKSVRQTQKILYFLYNDYAPIP